MSRQAYYGKLGRVDRLSKADEQALLERVRQIRRKLPRVGTRKLCHMMGADVGIGRDAFFALLRRHGLLIRPRRRFAVTTQADRFSRWKNLTYEEKPREAETLLVSDLTYIKGAGERYYYAALVTDAVSRRILGHDLSASLAPDGALRALEMALKTVRSTRGIIHHSDRGFQYNSRVYTQRLERAGIRISMTEQNHCYENALAERLNGILKHEFMLSETFPSLADARKALNEAVECYNTLRPHLALGYRTPEQQHQKLLQKPKPKSVNFS